MPVKKRDTLQETAGSHAFWPSLDISAINPTPLEWMTIIPLLLVSLYSGDGIRSELGE